MKTFVEPKIQTYQTPTRVEIDLSAIRHNYLTLKNLAASRITPQFRQSELIPVVKADAYGHGMVKVALLLQELGANFFAVSSVDEGVVLREAGIFREILVMEATLPDLAEAIVEHRLTPVVCTFELIRELNSYAQSINSSVNVHVKVDTGMGRLGVAVEDAFSYIEQLRQFSNIAIKGLCTHYPLADSDDEFTAIQTGTFKNLLTKLEARGLRVPYVHTSNSAGIISAQDSFSSLLRPGLLLYGLHPSETSRTSLHLKPAMTVKTQIIFLKKLARGKGISYGHTFIAPRDMLIATLPIGYNDGYFRSFSNKGYVLVDGQPCPVVGRVTMDQTMVDVSQVSNPVLGMPVVILGEQNDQMITADDLAQWADTINYEVVCALGNRLPRTYPS